MTTPCGTLATKCHMLPPAYLLLVLVAMCLGFVLILLRVAFLMGSVSPFLIVLLFAVLIDMVFIRTEERMMRVVFGKDWLVYKAKVRRWI
jgi:protein-S-isoprenylcysteine O-methyltransferase Ste14